MVSNVLALLIATLMLASCVTDQVTQRYFVPLRVIDGDTLTIRYDGEVTSVRLLGIDAPELRQAGGPESRAALEQMVSGRRVRVDLSGPRKRDNFGRLLANVYVDGRHVNEAMLQQNMATKR